MSQRHRGPRGAGPAKSSPERAGPRTRLPIPVTAKIGAAQSQDHRLHDVSVSGFRLDWADAAEPGEAAIVRFGGYPEVCPAFILHGRVVRVVGGKSPGLGIAIGDESSAESLEHYRRLVRHYMEHRPLLDEIARDFFEGRCEACEWLGRVGERAATCPCCGGRVRPLDPGQ